MGKKIAAFEAVAALVGTIIGAGVFTLPYIANKSGLIPTTIWLFIVFFILLYLHLAFGEVVCRSGKNFRLPGYVGYYLGPAAKKFVLITTFLTFSFSLLIYLSLGTEFLKTILVSFFPFINWTSGIIFLGLWLFLNLPLLTKSEGTGKLNLVLSFGLLIVFFVIIAYALPHFKTANLNLFGFSGAFGWFIPYGVIFYALNGMVGVPEAINLLKARQAGLAGLKKIIIWGTLIPLICYFLFIFAVNGVSGANTTLEAISGLRHILGPGIVIIGSALGFLAVATSYLIFATYIKKSFLNDFNWSPFISYFLVIFGPLLLYLMNLANIVKLVSFMGGMLGGFEGVMLVLVLNKSKRENNQNNNSQSLPYSLPLNRFIFSFLITALVIGAICQTFLVY